MMSIGTSLLVVGGVLILGLAPAFAFLGSSIAEMKGRCQVPWLILSGLFFPLLILLCFLPAKKSPESFSERYLSVIRNLGAISLQDPVGVGISCY